MTTQLSPRLVNAIFKKKRNILIYGPGGCGKSYCIAQIRDEAIKNGKVICLTSTTGLSALSINGMTIHKFSGIKIGEDPVDIIVRDICYKNKDCLERWKTTEILVVDEVSMLGKKTITKIDQVGRKIRKVDKPFGGIQVILTGDFCQLPPVNDDFCFDSDTMNELNLYPVNFTIPYRYPDIRHFEMLGRARKGQLNSDDIKLLESRVKCYQDYLLNEKDEKRVRKEGEISLRDIKPTRVYSRKDDVDRENLIELNKLPGNNSRYTSYDQFFKGKKKGSQKKDVETEPPIDDREAYAEYLSNIAKQYVLVNIGAQVMLTVNLDQEGGLVNGSRGVVVACMAEGVRVLFLNGKEVLIGLHAFSYKDEKYKVIRHQIPLILAWSTTIHKNQGQTLDYVIISLGYSIFQAGQGYVALSRAKTVEGIFIIDFMHEKIFADQKAIDYEDKLLRLEQANLDQEEEKQIDQPGSIDEKMGELSIQPIDDSKDETLDADGNRDYDEDEGILEVLDEIKRIAADEDSD